MSDKEPTYAEYEIRLCSLCVTGAGGECHSPGCALFLSRAPDISLKDNPMCKPICEEKSS